MPNTLSPYSPMALHTGVTTGNGNILVLKGQCSRVTIVIQGTGTTSGGGFSIEEAYYPDNGPVYAGTWSVVGTVNASDVSAGKQAVVHVSNYSIWALRVRISSDITGGGTVSVWAWGN